MPFEPSYGMGLRVFASKTNLSCSVPMRQADFGSEPDEEKYIHMHPGAHPDLVPWLLEKKIHIWGMDCISTDHPMNLPIGRFLGKGAQGHCDRVRAKAEELFGGPEGVKKMFPDSA